MIFKEKVEIYENKIKVTISCEMRKFADEDKVIFENARITNLLPEKFRNKVNLISCPGMKISNTGYSGCTNFGEWVFEIVKDKPDPAKVYKTQTDEVTPRTQKTTRTTRKSTTRKKQQ
tara:strand:- start:1155 stop:1508 length:354 start_codon:yes stop_codon:yes gene_type:complete